MDRKTSDAILNRLRQEAKEASRPRIRAATIDRLVEACNSIASGDARKQTRLPAGSQPSRTAMTKISASTIDRYIKARAKTDPSWTGPTRVTIQRDAGLRAYVTARESERRKPTSPRSRSSRQKLIEDAICQVPSVEAQMDLRHELESGRMAQRRLDILTAGLRHIPGIDIDHILATENPKSANLKRFLVVDSNSSGRTDSLTAEERETLRRLVERLTDNEELRRDGLTFSNGRVKVLATHRAVVKPLEMRLIQRLAGLEKQ